MTSDDTLPAAIIAAFVVGIGFVVVISIFFSPSVVKSDDSNTAVTLGEEGQTIHIDFSVSLPERDLIVKKGEMVRVPVTIETQGNVEKVLSLSIMPSAPDIEAPHGSELELSLDKERVVLSEDNLAMGKARITDYGWVITDAGFLTITASSTAADRIYEYIVEANWAGEPGGDVRMGSGQLITVRVVGMSDSDGQGKENGMGSDNMTSLEIPGVKVDVGGEPKEGMVQTGEASSLHTRYLPVNITHTIELSQPTRNITILPALADWDGIVRPDSGMYWLMHDKNDKPVTFDGFGYLTLHGVRATCTEPQPVRVLENEEDGIQLENTTIAVQSIIYWGDTVEISFGEERSGVLYYSMTGYGIVPHDYNDNNDKTYGTNGAGNQEIAGIYHLSFPSFYPAAINLPETAGVSSFTEIKCSIDEDSDHVHKSDFPQIYVYDVWFKIDD